MASAIAAVRRLARHVARIRYRLLLVNLLIAVVPVTGIAFAHMHEEQLLGELEADMIHQAQLVRAAVVASDTPLAGHEGMLAAAARDTRTRIRLLDATGTVVADSHRRGPPEGAERPVPYLLGGESPVHDAEAPRDVASVGDRREIREALAGRYGSATRLWDKQDRVYLFSALPIVRGGKTTGVVYVTRSTHDIKLQLYRLRTWLARVLIGTIVVTALLSLLLATTIARPLGKLTRRAQRIAARLPAESLDKLARRRDEIGQLARAVDGMTDELERRAHDARTLAADISHEFKTPLTGIRGAAELLRDGAADDSEVRDRFLAMIIDDTARLDRVVSRLLELARVDDDRTLALPVDLAALATRCASRPWPVPVKVDVAVADDAMVSGRESQLAAALDNLIANATQHADPDTPVTIRVERRDSATRIAVANVGPALSAVARRKVWDRFYSTRIASGGSGLGLAIVRSVAQAHGGTVGVHCESGTTTFWFEVRN